MTAIQEYLGASEGKYAQKDTWWRTCPRGVAVATTTRGELCRTTLPADSDEGRARLLPRTLGDDTAQHLLDRRQRLGLTDLLTHDRRLEGLDDLILSADLGDEVRAHIAAPLAIALKKASV